MALGEDGSEARLTGAVLVMGSAAAAGLAGVLTKSIDAGPFTILCWRGLLGAFLIAAYVAWTDRGRPVAESFATDWRVLVLATVGSFASFAFIAAFKHTYVANVAIIYAGTPFLAAAFGWLLIREKMRAGTAIAATVSLAGIGIVVSGGFAGFALAGDLMALAMTAACALYMALIRAFRGTPVVWAGAVSAAQLFAVGWLFADPLDVSRHDAVLLVAFGFTFALTLVLWTEGTRRISAGEAGLVGTLETPFAMLLAWLLLAELPPTASFLGGAVVLAAVLGHACAGWSGNRRSVRAPGPAIDPVAVPAPFPSGGNRATTDDGIRRP
jgi:drug/metabolite transporter (DMT)-like permease